MVNPLLNKICEFVDDWCRTNNIQYDLTCDEPEVQGIMIFKRDKHLLHGLLEQLQSLTNKIHVEQRRVRSGTVLIFSLQALNESTIAQIISDAGEIEMAPSFRERIIDALYKPHTDPVSESEPIDFIDELRQSAKKIASESQYKSATKGITRANKASTNRSAINNNGGGCHGPVSAKKKKPSQFESKINHAFTTTPKSPTPVPQKPVFQPCTITNRKGSDFDSLLGEALDGMATSSGAQPQDLYQKFARALQVLGSSISVGPLQDKLKEQGIKWKVAGDGLSIILYIMNAATNAPQPIARISAQTLENPSDFEEQLTSMLDFAMGQAPGTEKQRREELRAREKAVRDVAQAVAPNDDAIATAMNGGEAMPGATPQAGQAAMQPQAGQTATPQAGQAAMQPQTPQQGVGQAAKQAASSVGSKPSRLGSKPMMTGGV